MKWMLTDVRERENKKGENKKNMERCKLKEKKRKRYVYFFLFCLNLLLDHFTDNLSHDISIHVVFTKPFLFDNKKSFPLY